MTAPLHTPCRALAAAILLFAHAGSLPAQDFSVRKPSAPDARLILTPLDMQYLTARARAALYQQPFDRPPPPNCSKEHNVRVFITLFRPPAPALRVTVSESSLAQSVNMAAISARVDPSFIEQNFQDPSAVRIKIDVVASKHLVFPHPSVNALLPLIPGLEGLSLRKGDNDGFVLPAEIVAGRLAGRSRLLEAACLDAGLPPTAWQSLSTEVYRLRTRSFIEREPNGKLLLLYRAVPLVDDLSADLLLRSAVQAGKWLVDHQAEDGTFNDAYSPIAGKPVGRKYSITRHAGAVLSLLRLYRVSADARFLKAAERATAFLLRHVEKSDHADKFRFVHFEETARIGANALALLSLLELDAVTGQKRHRDVAKDLGTFLIHMQKEDGSTFASYSYTQRKKDEDTFSHVGPSQALLGLVTLAEATGDEKSLRAAMLTADYITDKRDEEMNRTEPLQDYWAMRALARLYEISHDPVHAEYCFSIAEAVLAHQLTAQNTALLDYVGASDYGVREGNPPGTLPTAARCTGLIAAWKLAGEMGLPRAHYASAIRKMVRFILQNQYTPGNSYYLPHPSAALGAFRTNFLDDTIQIDCIQHSITALLGATDLPVN